MKPGYTVLSIRELLRALTEAQKPSSDGCAEISIASCVVLEGELTPEGQLQVRNIRRV